MEIEVETPGLIPARTCPDIVIRASSDADVEAMVAIYEHHISRGVSDVGVALPRGGALNQVWLRTCIPIASDSGSWRATPSRERCD